jgi:hypothetical protein
MNVNLLESDKNQPLTEGSGEIRSKALDAFDFVKNHQLPKQYLFILKGGWDGFGEIPDSTNLNLQEVKYV